MLAQPAERATLATFGHREADAMRQVPRGLHAAREHALYLARADALLAGAHEVDDLKPQVQRKWLSSKIEPIRTVKGLRQA